MSGGHGHGVPAAGQRRALTVVLSISSAILAAEAAGAFLSGSLALLADAGHMLSDVAGLALALAAAILAAQPATDTRTWGYLRAEVLAAAAQAAVLLAVGGFVLAEAVRRLIHPSAVEPGVMLVFGVVALAGNAVSVLVLLRLEHRNLNTRAALLETASDALGAFAGPGRSRGDRADGVDAGGPGRLAADRRADRATYLEAAPRGDQGADGGHA